MNIKGVEFEVEVDWDSDGMIENIAVFLPGSDVELSYVLDEKVIQKIEEQAYKDGLDRGADQDDPREDR